jgi:hypothetical protein
MTRIKIRYLKESSLMVMKATESESTTITIRMIQTLSRMLKLIPMKADMIHGMIITETEMLQIQTGVILQVPKPTITTIPGGILGDGTAVTAHIGV